MNFTELDIHKRLNNVLEQNGINKPTRIQQEAIPLILEGNDVIAQAQTGTGKTLAFLLPIFEKIDVKERVIQGLVITPTRELALQITSEAKKLALGKKINFLAAYGGQDVLQQVRKLKGSIHLVIGTPGRILDHLRRKTMDLSHLKMLVLDEADQMLDMGFLEDIEKIIRYASTDRQTMLFSATLPDDIKKLASRYMKDPSRIQIRSKGIILDEIRQVVVETTDRKKIDSLCSVIEEYQPFLAIIFCRTKRRVSRLNEELHRRGYNSDEIHGDLSQAKRERAMRAFRKTKTRLLVATDVAARGLDVQGITHVLNYDIPRDTESYIHRIGRTGRAGETGVAITFITPADRRFLRTIEKDIKVKIEKHSIGKEDAFKEQTYNKRIEKPRRQKQKYNVKSNRTKPNKKRTNTSKGRSKSQKFETRK